MLEYNIIKCHGCGNDFVIINGILAKLPNLYIKKLVSFLTDRKGPLGADGIICIENSKIADAKVIFFNPNGNRTKMCLNGIRCVARLIFENSKNNNNFVVKIETDAGIIKIDTEFDVENNIEFYVVNDIIDIDFNAKNVPIKIDSRECIDKRIDFLSKDIIFSAIKVYTPHLIALVDHIDENILYNIGVRANANIDIFPEGINVSFVKILNKDSIFVRTFERDNIGMSLSCSSAMVASACVLVKLKKMDTNNWINIYNKGGLIKANCNRDNNNFCVRISGPATIVYSAKLEINDMCLNRVDNQEDVGRFNVVNGNVDLNEIDKYNNFLIETKEQSGEKNFLNEML